MSTNLTSGQIYEYDQFGQQQLTDLPTRMPNDACFKFFHQSKCFEILWSKYKRRIWFCPNAQAVSPTKQKEPFLPTLYFLYLKVR
jgi:hypothetical protein